MKTILRKVRDDDHIHFSKWWRDKELVSLTSGNFEEMTDQEIKKSVALMAQNNLHWLIEADGKTVGHINLEKINGRQAELQIVIGEKEYWGKGVAKSAVSQVLIKAIDLGYRNIYLEVRPTNSRAIAFYKKMGFTKTGTKKYPENKNMPVVVTMSKDYPTYYTHEKEEKNEKRNRG